MKFRPIVLTAAAAVVFAACGTAGSTSAPTAATPTVAPSSGPMSMAPSMSMEPTGSATTGGVVTDSPAADLRTKLNLALGEHIIFASKATGAALGGRAEEFAAYGDLLNKNGTEIGATIGSVYGAEAEDAFNKIWSAHNGFFVDYTTGVAKKDMAMQDKAVNDLTTIYVPQFADFISWRDRPAEGRGHLAHDRPRPPDQGHRRRPGQEGLDRRLRRDPDRLRPHADDRRRARPGHRRRSSRTSSPVTRRTRASTSASRSTSSSRSTSTSPPSPRALRSTAGPTSSPPSVDALNTNGTDVGGAIGSLYGDEAKDAFNKIWSAHNGFFVDYTTGVATKDQAMHGQGGRAT